MDLFYVLFLFLVGGNGYVYYFDCSESFRVYTYIKLIKLYTLNIVQSIVWQFYLNKGTKNIKFLKRNHAKYVQSLYTWKSHVLSEDI